MQPDAIIEVCFKTEAIGGRQTSVGGPNTAVDYYSCPLVIDGEALDCRLLLAGRCLVLGEINQVPVKFLNPQLAIPHLAAGKPISLWEGKEVAVGKIVRVLRES